MSTRDLYIPDTHFHRRAQDPVDIILSDSVYNFQVHDDPIDMLSRDVPSSRKEDATIVFLERSNRPLVRICVCNTKLELIIISLLQVRPYTSRYDL